MATYMAGPDQSTRTRMDSMPFLSTSNWTSHRARKQIQPRVERPKIEFSAKGCNPGKIFSTRTTTATEASQVWMPYQKTAIKALTRAGMLAPKTPKPILDRTG